MQAANKISSDEIVKRIGHLADGEFRDMLSWLGITKQLPDRRITKAAELCGINQKYAFRGIWDEQRNFSYLWYVQGFIVAMGVE